jgi:hypothetical protein
MLGRITMSGRALVLGIIALLLGTAAWTLSRRTAKRESSSPFKPWIPQR